MSLRTISEDYGNAVAFFDKLGDKISGDVRVEAFKNIQININFLSSSAYYELILLLQYFIFDYEGLELQFILPTTTIPKYYKLHIDASGLSSGSTDFSGEVAIDILIEQATYYIMMHSRQQIVDSCRVFYKNGTEVTLLDFHFYPGFWFTPSKSSLRNLLLDLIN